MNNELARQGDGYRPHSYPLAHFTPGVDQRAAATPQGQGVDFAAIIRIIKEWKWLVLGVLAAGILLGLLSSLLTTKMYRAWVTLEVNPPTVEILDEKSREVSTQTSWDLMATQVGLLSSRTLAQRVAEDLNLAADRNFVGADGDGRARSIL